MLAITSAHIAAVRQSELFDESWYCREYPDVERVAVDPAEHFLRIGGVLLRNPSPRFDTSAYLNSYDDVAAEGINPLLHYLLFGRAEGRIALRVEALKAVHSAKPPSQRRLKVAVIAWDVGHNPVGRAYLLADVLSRKYETVLVGGQFPQYGKAVWEPLRSARVPIIPFPGSNYPAFADTLDDLAARLDCDVLLACKPRMPSLQLALAAKARLNRPLILDVDDYELSFFKDQRPGSLKEVAEADDRHVPHGQSWTSFAQTLIPLADGLIVSNPALQARYGGVVVSHARDELVFDPALYDREACRREIGIPPEQRMVLFAGTARGHKGLVETARAVASLGDPSVVVAVVGTIADPKLKAAVAEAGAGAVKFFPNQPFALLPRFLAAADLVCLPQDIGHPTSAYQLPAKLIDALAMGVPVLSSRTPPMAPFIAAGAAIPITNATLAATIAGALPHIETLRSEQLARRKVFLDGHSYAAALDALDGVIATALDRPRALRPVDLSFRKAQRQPDFVRGSTAPRRSKVAKKAPFDIVVFWRQGDAGVYGRRSDMLAKYFARRPDIGKVLFVDPPTWIGTLSAKVAGVDFTEHRLVYEETVARTLGLRDGDTLFHRTFVYHTSARDPAALWPYPKKDEYLPWLEATLSELGFDPARSIFWLFPVNDALPSVVQRFKPLLSVVDIVDDQRQQPGISEARRSSLDAAYREVLALADLAVTNADPVRTAMKAFAPAMRLLPNAAELDPPDPAIEIDVRAVATRPGPVIGYVGNLESKIDEEILAYLAKTRPDWNIVLIGSTHSRPTILELKRFPNIFFTGVIKYELARAWIGKFDVAIMPHLATGLTETMNPLKLFVYLAARVPVVSTPVPNISELIEFVSIASTPRAFRTAIEAALAGRRPNWDKLGERLAEHSWPARIETAMAWMREILAERANAPVRPRRRSRRS